MVSSTIAGAEYGLTLAWALAAGVLVKFAVTEGVARWQLVTGATLVEGWRDHLPRVASLAFFVYFIAWSFFVSAALVAASALAPAAVMPAVPLPAWVILHAVAACALVYFGRYEQLLRVMKWFIVLMFASLLATVLLIVFRSGADWSAAGNRSPVSAPYVLSLIGGIGGTVTLLSYGYWMREQGWNGRARLPSARVDLTISFALAFVFASAMMFLSSQIQWTGQILDEGPRLSLLLADRIGAEIGPLGRALFLVGFWGAAYSSVVGVYHGVPFLFDDLIHTWRRQPPTGQRGLAYRGWALYLTAAAVSGVLIQRPVWLVFAYTVVGALFFPFVIATLLWLNNSRLMPVGLRSGAVLNLVLGAALVLYAYLAVTVL
ncbi:MAG: Nramp family divalent metal transporter [Acidobacteria bacterium]|nr:Nramp family divalent metal transporter [Acidobacteriota bacterium]